MEFIKQCSSCKVVRDGVMFKDIKKMVVLKRVSCVGIKRRSGGISRVKIRRSLQ
jgi:hypothetical protein